MKKEINIIIGIISIMILFFGSLSWADTNGIWQFANDTRGGTFGGDEQVFGMNYTFINPVYFDKPLISLVNSNYYINLNSRTQLNDLVTNSLTTNSATINGNLVVTNTIATNTIKSNSGGDVVILLG